MSEHSIDPYAPPETDVENHDYNVFGKGKTYKDDKLLIIHQDYIFPETCPRTGSDSQLERHNVQIKGKIKWRYRPLWVNLFACQLSFLQ